MVLHSSGVVVSGGVAVVVVCGVVVLLLVVVIIVSAMIGTQCLVVVRFGGKWCRCRSLVGLMLVT